MSQSPCSSSQLKQLHEQLQDLTISINHNQQFISKIDYLQQFINSLCSNFEKQEQQLSSLTNQFQNNLNKIEEDLSVLNKLPRKFEFDIKKHIEECLDISKIKIVKQKIKNKKLELDNLYNKLEQYLQKEEPYINDKVMMRIKIQVQSHGRAILFKNIKKQHQKHSNWKQKQINVAIGQSNLDQMSKSVAQNASMLTQIRNRKVLANDIIFSQLSQLQKTKQKLKQIPQIIEKMKIQLKEKLSRNM